MHKKGIAEFAAILLITIIGVGSIWGVNQFVKSDSTQSPIPRATADSSLPSETQTPVAEFKEFPFMELTIPYFRNREYNSQLSDLQVFSEKPNYTAYTTSYSSDNYKINSYLTIPKGDQPSGGWPAIVFIHGYIPPTVYQTTQNYVNYVDYFARNGFVVIKPDLRGHDNSEGEAFGAYYAGDYIIDTLNAYAALQASEFVNSNQIGLWGHSMGGNVVFRSLVGKQDIPAAVIWAGAVYTYEDMGEFSIQDNSYRPPSDDSARRKYRNDLNNLYGSFDADSEYWQKVVPVNYLDNVNSSLQIHHAVNDNVVNIGYSRNLINILNNSDINAELVEYQSGGHNITSPSFERAMDSSVEFYKSVFGIN